MKKTIPTLSIFFYVLAVVFLLFACFHFIESYRTVSAVLESSQSTGIEFSDILGLYISQVGPYVAYSSLLYGMGYVIAKLNEPTTIDSEEEIEEASFVGLEEDTLVEDVTEEAKDDKEEEINNNDEESA